MDAVFWKNLSQAVFNEETVVPGISYCGRLPGPLPVSELLAETVGLFGASLARLVGQAPAAVHVDARLSAFWAVTSCLPIGWSPPEPWDPFSAVFKGADGWIRLHTNAPHHKAAAMTVLGEAETKAEVAAAIMEQPVALLEQKIIDAGGAAAKMILWADWQAHPQGQAIAATPLVEWTAKPTRATERLQAANYSSSRPLEGLRVLDLTRVLAGPVATRTLAGYGADVLRIDPNGWDDPGLLQDTTIGKHCAELDLTQPSDRAQFEALLSEADVFVHGYRPSALAGLGYDEATLDRINPAKIDISLSAYGWQGPWAARRGYDSLVQFSTGIAELCADAEGRPGKLPVQALDHAAGHIMAACCLEALRIAQSGRIMAARTSLARIAGLLCQAKYTAIAEDPLPPKSESDYESEIQTSDWGPLKRLRPPLTVGPVPMCWDVPAGELRRHQAQWQRGRSALGQS